MPRLVPLALAVGALAAVTAASSAAAAKLLVSGSDSYLAATTNAGGAISSFESQTTGSLGGNVISRDGRFAYMADTTNRAILQFARDRGTGVLSPLSSAISTAGEIPNYLAITADGRWLLATTNDGGSNGRMRAYPVAEGGTLGAAASTVIVPGTIGQPAITPDGRHVYAASTYAGDWIYMWSLGADGTIAALSTNRVNAGDLVGQCVVMAPTGESLYAPSGGANSGSGTQVVRWIINPVTGLLSTSDTLPSDDGHAGACEGSISSNQRLLAIGITGMFGDAYARVWPLDAEGRVGTQAPSLTYASGSVASGFALDPTGSFGYATSISFSTEGGLHQMRLTGDGATAIPAIVGGIPTTPWSGVSVAPAQPAMAALAPATGRAGAALALDASGSTDPDTQIARYDWQFGDGSFAADAGPRPEHVYARAGEYTARVTVTNTAGCSTDPMGNYTGRMNSCIGGPTATATATVRVTTPPAREGATPTSGGVTPRPATLAAAMQLRNGVGTTTGTMPAGATRVTQTARTGGSAATQGFLEMARAKTAKGTCTIAVVRSKKTKKVTKRTYRCTIRLTKGAWTVATAARGAAGVVAESSRRVVVR
jgi:6-phosphogluconolactonase (cycloisomerase 2 family)